MKEINDVLKKNEIRTKGYRKNGKVVFADTDKGLFIVKKNNIDNKILDYLNNRGFIQYPETIFDKDYIVSKYEEDSNIPSEQKMLDLIETISLLHNKTSFYKETSNYEYKTIYEDILNNLEHLYVYYSDYINSIDQKVIYSPSEFLLARNISYIFKSIENCKSSIDEWYKDIENMNKMHVSVIHNNLDLSHFIRNKKNYLISWDNSKIDMPIYDLYKLYNKYYLDYSFKDLLNKYDDLSHLELYEKKLFLILINIPKKIEYTNEYDTCVNICNEIDRLCKSNEIKNSLAI